MDKRNGFRKVLLCGGFAAATAAWSGSNGEAEVFLDLDHTSVSVESTLTRPAGSAVWMSVRISKARYLDTYGFKVAYDDSLLTFVQAVAGQPGEGYRNVLETRGGSAPFFIGKLSVLDSTRVSVANSLEGSDSTRSPSGEGLLALLQFKSRGSGQAAFRLEELELLDWNQAPGAPAAVHGAVLTLQPSLTLRRRLPQDPVVRMRDGRLEVDLGIRSGTLWSADAQGRVLFRERW
jgi:hypothetical protein